MTAAARMLPTKMVQPAISSRIQLAMMMTAPKKKISKAVNRITSAKTSSGCCSAPSMSSAPTMPKTTKASPCSTV